MIQDGYNGVLVHDNPNDISKGLQTLMDNVELRVKLGKNAAESMKRFSPDIIWSQWEELIYETKKK